MSLTDFCCAWCTMKGDFFVSAHLVITIKSLYTIEINDDKVIKKWVIKEEILWFRVQYY